MSDIINLAKKVSKEAHESIGQKRKYSGKPYYLHPWAVAERVKEITFHEETVVAAYLHDILEDVEPKNSYYGHSFIWENFGQNILVMVDNLTKKYTKEIYPYLNRKERLILENERLKHFSDSEKLIKIADIEDNIKDILLNPKFAQVYIQEKLIQIEVLNTQFVGYEKFRLDVKNTLLNKQRELSILR